MNANTFEPEVVPRYFALLSRATPWLPLACALWLFLWLRFGLRADPVDDHFVTSPLWWERTGLDALVWIRFGFAPAILCLVVGLLVMILGDHYRMPEAEVKGIRSLGAGIALTVYNRTPAGST